MNIFNDNVRISLYGNYAAFIRSKYSDDMHLDIYFEKYDLPRVIDDFHEFGFVHGYMSPAVPKHDVKKELPISELKSKIDRLTGELVERVCQVENELKDIEFEIRDLNNWFDDSIAENGTDHIIGKLHRLSQLKDKRKELKAKLNESL